MNQLLITKTYRDFFRWVKYFLITGFVFMAVTSYGQGKQVCFSYDDLPLVNYGITDTVYQKKLMDKLVVSLNKNRIPAIGFVNEKKLYNNGIISPFQVGLLEAWIAGGFELGNHTYSHPDINNTYLDTYFRDILSGEKLSKELLLKYGKTMKYFRHPYLHTGPTKEKADSLNQFLLQQEYKVAPVTIDNEDYLFALAYKRANAKNDTTLAARIGRDYISYMEDKLLYYEKQSALLFGRNISHIVLLHASALNSDYADSLAVMFRNNNYAFISIDKALQDPCYNTGITVFGKWGISWIDRWALSQGKKGDFFKDDPATPAYIAKLAE